MSSDYGTSFTPDTLDQIADTLALQGYIKLANALDSRLTQALAQDAQQSAPDFQAAGIGREQQHQLNHTVRSDRIHWLTGTTTAEQAYLSTMEQLRAGLNQRLFMGLFDHEAHFAHYPPGARYQKHLDAFKGRTNRVLTSVFYLNAHWPAEAGGELLVYDNQAIVDKVLPEAGTLVIFLSDRFPHEVLPADQDRFSIAGWFRVNTSSTKRIDPAS